jgi:hypothetical protein
MNALCWKGGDLNNFKEIIEYGLEEEPWISESFSKIYKKSGIICGNALCAHAGFAPQRTPDLELLIQEYDKYV